MEITVKNRFTKDTPRKLRLVADAVKRMPALKARDSLTFINKAAAKPILKTLNSALAIVKEKGLEADQFKLGAVRCDQGPRIKRRLMKSRGQSTLIQKRMSHLTLTITDEIFKEKIKKQDTRNKQIRNISNSKPQTLNSKEIQNIKPENSKS